MEMDKILTEKVNKIANINNEEYLRFELYGIFAHVIFSKDLFKSNKDIALFLDAINIEHKPYLFKTRGLIISKTLSALKKADKEKIQEYKNKVIIFFINDDQTKEKKVEKSDNNYMRDILDKFGRGK